jgi:ankyrin repeat protein
MLHPLLFDSNIDFNISLTQDGGDTILHFILRTPQERFQDNKEDIIKLLLRTGANPFRCDQLGDTAFHLLAGDTRPAGSSTEGGRLLRLLLEGCPELREPSLGSIDKKNDFGDTPLIIAVLYDNIECAQLLLKHGADPYKLGEYGMTALDFAVEREYTEIAGLLLGYMTDQKQEQSETPAGG